MLFCRKTETARILGPLTSRAFGYSLHPPPISASGAGQRNWPKFREWTEAFGGPADGIEYRILGEKQGFSGEHIKSAEGDKPR